MFGITATKSETKEFRIFQHASDFFFLQMGFKKVTSRLNFHVTPSKGNHDAFFFFKAPADFFTLFFSTRLQVKRQRKPDVHLGFVVSLMVRNRL